MDAGELKAIQGPLKEKYRQDPQSALITLRAGATAIGVEVHEARIRAEGDLDFRGTLGVAKDVPVGFSSIRLELDIDTSASEEQAATLLKLTERYCVVLQTLRSAPPVTARIVRRDSLG